MIKQIQKFKSLIGYNDQDDVKDAENSINEPKIDTVEETSTTKCDCCGDCEIQIKKSEMFQITVNGERNALFTKPTIETFNGTILDDVAICNECFSSCETNEQKQYIWIGAKVNSLLSEIEGKNSIISDKQTKIEKIRTDAESEMQKEVLSINEVVSEINIIESQIALYKSELETIEELLSK